MGRDREFIGRAHEGKLSNFTRPEALISGPFLPFSKAYLNVICLYKGIRSQNKTTARALAFIECALRNFNQGNNDPANLNRQVIIRADLELQKSAMSDSKKYDIGREIEIFSNMLQSGHHSKNFRFSGKGFHLIDNSFSYSTIQKQARHLRVAVVDVIGDKENETRLSGEVAASVGIAFRSAKNNFGVNHRVTFMAAVAAMPLTTVSMRMSDYLSLRHDCLQFDQDAERWMISIYRPKIDLHQKLPITQRLTPVSLELVRVIDDYTRESREAFSFYIDRFSEDFESIDELYIPERFRSSFEEPFLSLTSLQKIVGGEGDESSIGLGTPYQGIRSVQVLGVDTGNDIYSPSKMARNLSFLKVYEARRRCLAIGLILPISTEYDDLFISAPTANQALNRKNPSKLKPILDQLWCDGRPATVFVPTETVKVYLLSKFKAQKFPHWPYTAKDRKLRLDHALLVLFSFKSNQLPIAENKDDGWWCPRQMTAPLIEHWISQYQGGAPLLFSSLNIKLRNGSWPSFTLHDLRKYHHTEALLAGASEPFIDELAGRHGGRQSAHYDKRTAHEVVTGSMEVFDPNQDFSVYGPIADQVPIGITVVERGAFLFENAAPKQVTEVGGCSTDWSLNPCPQFGDCMRCNKSLWRKGDRKRLPRIRALHDYAQSMLLIAEGKILPGQEQAPLRRHIQQHRDTISRCEEIFAVEANPDIEIGAIATFNSAPLAMSTADLVVKLREESGDDE
ncbi:MAG: hypothetical protein ABIR76_04355 [Polaromonas sp.]